MSEFYRPPENAEQPSDQDPPGETTPAEAFGREADTVPVSRTTDQAATDRSQGYGDDSEGPSGSGGGRSTTDVRHFEVNHPRRAIELDRDTRIVATAFDPRQDAWKVVTSTPR